MPVCRVGGAKCFAGPVKDVEQHEHEVHDFPLQHKSEGNGWAAGMQGTMHNWDASEYAEHRRQARKLQVDMTPKQRSKSTWQREKELRCRNSGER